SLQRPSKTSIRSYTTRPSSPMTTSRLRRPTSVSMTQTFSPSRASAAPTLAVVVVLPTPPLPDVTTMALAFTLGSLLQEPAPARGAALGLPRDWVRGTIPSRRARTGRGPGPSGAGNGRGPGPPAGGGGVGAEARQARARLAYFRSRRLAPADSNTTVISVRAPSPESPTTVPVPNFGCFTRSPPRTTVTPARPSPERALGCAAVGGRHTSRANFEWACGPVSSCPKTSVSTTCSRGTSSRKRLGRVGSVRPNVSRDSAWTR